MPVRAEQRARARQRFEAVFHIIRGELIAHVEELGFPIDVVEWFSTNLDYNVPGGKLYRGLTVVETVEILKGRPLTYKEYLQAAVLGWCVELLESVFLVSDDLLDSSTTRRGRPCWYRKPNVGLIAINDAFILESAIYWLLKKHFRKEPSYIDLVDLFHDTIMRTELGQLLDLITASGENVDLGKFSLRRHRQILLYKTAYYSFYLPVALAMHMCGFPRHEGRPDAYSLVASILLPLGVHCQVLDDFHDFAGTCEKPEKVGTDIVTGRCTWCINVALSLASPAQRAVLDAHYGRRNTDSERRVRAVFEGLGIRERFSAYERHAYKDLTTLIRRIPIGDEATGEVKLRRAMFNGLFDKVYYTRK